MVACRYMLFMNKLSRNVSKINLIHFKILEKRDEAEMPYIFIQECALRQKNACASPLTVLSLSALISYRNKIRK